MSERYDADYIRAYYDAYGEREWLRLDADPINRANFHLHRHYLLRHVRSGDRVLEAGAGPGRFTIELARLGARVTVGDISPVQLAANAEHVRQAGYEAAVVSHELLDIVDLSRFPGASFDVTVCYGGPLSYVFDQADTALAELLRVTRPNGPVLLSVMSLLGATRVFLPAVLDLARDHGREVIDPVVRSGDLIGLPAGDHYCHMYRWRELAALFSRHGCEIVAASAANFLTTNLGEAVTAAADDPTLWRALLDWEIEYSQEPGALDGGTHIIAVVRRPAHL